MNSNDKDMARDLQELRSQEVAKKTTGTGQSVFLRDHAAELAEVARKMSENRVAQQNSPNKKSRPGSGSA